MKVTVFGGSGFTGSSVVEECISRGYEVTVLVRDPSKLSPEFKDKVTVVEGDVLDFEDVEDAVEGVEAVVVILGTRSNLDATTDLSEGLKNIIKAMSAKNIKNISVCLSAFLFYEPEKLPPRFGPLTDDHRRMLTALEASQLNYVAVLPPHIADLPKAGFVVAEGKTPGGRTVSKRDLAEFLVSSLSQPEYYGKRIGISSK